LRIDNDIGIQNTLLAIPPKLTTFHFLAIAPS